MSLEWENPAIILDVVPYGETSLLVYALTRDYGLWQAMVKGGASSKQNVHWQKSVICLLRWRARQEGQLGFFSSEVIKNPAMILLSHPSSLLMISSACALCHKTLAQKEKQETIFNDLLRFLSLLMIMGEEKNFADYFRWEVSLLGALGYGLDFSACAVTGQKEKEMLKYVSPRTGRAVSEEGAGVWRDKLLPLPSFLLDETEQGDEGSWQEAQKLLGYFWHHVVFAALHKAPPPARHYLMERILHSAFPVEREEE